MLTIVTSLELVKMILLGYGEPRTFGAATLNENTFFNAWIPEPKRKLNGKFWTRERIPGQNWRKIIQKSKYSYVILFSNMGGTF